jgi:hypothetical protein
MRKFRWRVVSTSLEYHHIIMRLAHYQLWLDEGPPYISDYYIRVR